MEEIRSCQIVGSAFGRDLDKKLQKGQFSVSKSGNSVLLQCNSGVSFCCWDEKEYSRLRMEPHEGETNLENFFAALKLFIFLGEITVMERSVRDFVEGQFN